MVSYAQPTIEKRPDRLCLHIGTNDLKSNDPDVVADNIRKLAQRVEDSCGAEISVSELTQESITRSEHLPYLLLELSFLQTELFLERLSRQANNAFVY